MLHALGRAECPVPGGWRAHVMAGRAGGEASTGILSTVGERPPPPPSRRSGAACRRHASARAIQAEDGRPVNH